MTQYCNIGQKVSVYYGFNGNAQNQRVIFTNPVEVATSTKIQQVGNQNNEGYRLTWHDPNRNVTSSAIITDYYIADNLYAGPTKWAIYIKPCNSLEMGIAGFIDTPGSEVQDFSVTCPGKTRDDVTATITVSQNGRNIWSASGKNSVSYGVVCGDACPEGQCKCASTNYPGYCCLPCSQVASEIASITAIARSKR